MDKKFGEILEKYQPHSENALEKILKRYKDIVNEIAEEDFTKIEAALDRYPNENILLDKEKMAETLKTSLYEDISKELTSSWSKNGISDKVKVLEYYKELHAENTNKWRPTGKTVEEQVRPYYVKILLKKKQCFEKHLKYLAEQLELMIQKCVEARDYLNNVSSKRTELSQRMEADIKNLESKSQQIRETQLKLNEMMW